METPAVFSKRLSAERSTDRVQNSHGAPSSVTISPRKNVSDFVPKFMSTRDFSSGIRSKSPNAPKGLSAMPSKQLICTFVGVQPTPRDNRRPKSPAGKAFPRTLPAISQVAANIR